MVLLDPWHPQLSSSCSSNNKTLIGVTATDEPQDFWRHNENVGDGHSQIETGIDQKVNDAQGRQFDGVAITLMLRAPKWFHRRYTVMIHNVLANIPSTWAVQVFVNDDWFETEVLPLHPTLRELRSKSNESPESSRIIWTPLPKSATTRKTKPKEIMKMKWLWQSVVAENVLVFSGNGAMCANTKRRLSDFTDYDYVGVPWYNHNGQGGDGSTHSFRHRSAMLRILERHPPEGNDAPDYQYFVKEMLKDSSSPSYKVADRPTTVAFGGTEGGGEFPPLVVSGTQTHMNWTARDTLLGVCPELKTIFPSLHEPSCFGAHPDGAKCKETICALQDLVPGHGC